MPRITRILPRRQGSWLELVCAGGGGVAHTPGTGLRLPADKLPSWAGAGSELSWEQYRELEQLCEYEQLLDRALRLLGRREHFNAELRDKLGQPRLTLRQREAQVSEGPPMPPVADSGEKAVPAPQPQQPARRASRELVERVLAACRGFGYLDDRRAAVYVITALAARGDVGRRKVREELLRRGCAAPLADELLEKHAGEFDDKAAMAELLRKKRRSLESRAKRLREKLQKQIDEQDNATEDEHKEHQEHEGHQEETELGTEELSEAGEPALGAATRPKPTKKSSLRKPRKDERWLRFELKGRLSAAVFTLLATRGFGGDDARRAAQTLVDELLEL